MSNVPDVSVIMAVYNAVDTVQESIESILSQTFLNFEFIVIDDGSTDGTSDIIDMLAAKDDRVKIIRHNNKGLTVSLNIGLKASSGKYVARQDADDISYKSRLKDQYKLMESNPKLVLCGSNCINIYEDGTETEWGSESIASLSRSVLYKTPFPHTTAFMCGDVARKLGGYDETFKTSQDMEFWMRFAKVGQISMLSEAVASRRILSSSISVKRRWRQFYDAFRARWRHNPNKLEVTYYSIRGLLIGFLPAKIIKILKREII